jgi:hypothetical protein
MDLVKCFMHGMFLAGVKGPLQKGLQRWGCIASTSKHIPFEYAYDAILLGLCGTYMKKVGSGASKLGGFGRILDFTDGLKVPYKVPLEEMFYH